MDFNLNINETTSVLERVKKSSQNCNLLCKMMCDAIQNDMLDKKTE